MPYDRRPTLEFPRRHGLISCNLHCGRHLSGLAFSRQIQFLIFTPGPRFDVFLRLLAQGYTYATTRHGAIRLAVASYITFLGSFGTTYAPCAEKKGAHHVV